MKTMTEPSRQPAQFLPLPRAARVCVLVPCYNEGVAIFDTVQSLRAALPAAQIIVFDNNSADNTVAEALRAGADVRQVPLQGKGNVVRRMFADVDADVYLMVDGDSTYDARAAPRLVNELLDHRLDMVVGRRHAVEDATYRSGHRFGNWALTSVVATLFGRSFEDMLSGYRAFSRRFAKSFPAQSKGFEIETELTVHALRLRLPVREIDTDYFARPEGSQSKLNTYRDGARILMMIVGLLKSERPMAFFGAIAALAAIISVVLAIPIWITFLETGLVPRLPTAVLCATLAIIAVISLVCGILLDAVTAGRLEARYANYLRQEQYWPPSTAAITHEAINKSPSSRERQLLPPAVVQQARLVWATVFSSSALYAWLSILIGTLVATVMRQDFNWDLQNYHLYNPHALLGGRYSTDLGAAMLQSYFNPLIDVPHYWLSVVQNWNSRWVAFVTGCFHGLAAAALLFVARNSMPASENVQRTALLVTILGCLTCSFVMGVGTTMGDNTTTVLVMAALAMVVAEANANRTRPVRITRLGVAGLLAGIACGLKLTAAPYAVALMAAVAVLAAPHWQARALRATAFAAATVAGIAISAGWWYAFLWQAFGNPLFPQFNQIFGSPLAAPVMYGDPGAWQPRSLLEALTFPFVVVANPVRISEIAVHPLIWPITYCLALASVVLIAVRRFTGSPSPQPAAVANDRSEAQRVVFTFGLVSFGVWMFAFGIFRYTVALEMVLPLIAWMLIARLPVSGGWRMTLLLLVILASLSTLHRPAFQERVEFAKKSYRIETPKIAHPDSTTILLVGDQPMAWLLTGFPSQIAAIGLASNLQESPGYVERANRIMRERGGKVLALIRADSSMELDPANAAYRDSVDQKLRNYERTLAGGECQRYRARTGEREMHYQLCEVSPL